MTDEMYEEFDKFWQEQEWQNILAEKRKEIDDVPINLILDTNWWIYLTKEENFEVLQEIIKNLNTGKFRILVPEVIIQEWERNLNHTKDSAQQTILNQCKNAKRISSFIEEPERSQLESILERYTSKEEIRLDAIQKTIDIIEDLIRSKSVIIPISEETKDRVIEFGIQKKAPFKSKNSVGDAIIFFSSMEYLKKETDTSVSSSIFISNNSDDFSKSIKEKDIIHPDLEPFINETKAIFERNIAKALKLTDEMQHKIEEYLNFKAESKLEDEYIEHQIEMHIQHQIDIARGK
mgnify:CR=1 FL=1